MPGAGTRRFRSPTTILFILGDSIPSDFNTQRFNLSGTVAYKPLERLILALKLDYDTGSSANQTDPRPKTDGMHFVITPGVQYLMGGGFSLGLWADST